MPFEAAVERTPGSSLSEKLLMLRGMHAASVGAPGALDFGAFITVLLIRKARLMRVTAF
mgnify:CR=1